MKRHRWHKQENIFQKSDTQMYLSNTKCLYIVVHNIVGFMDQSAKAEES